MAGLGDTNSDPFKTVMSGLAVGDHYVLIACPGSGSRPDAFHSFNKYLLSAY